MFCVLNTQRERPWTDDTHLFTFTESRGLFLFNGVFEFERFDVIDRGVSRVYRVSDGKKRSRIQNDNSRDNPAESIFLT